MNRKKISYSILALVFVVLFFSIIDHYHRTVAQNTEIRMNIAKLESLNKPPPPIQGEKNGRIVIEKDNTNPIEIEMIGVLKLKINDNILWETIAKILVLLLCSYGGVKYINKKFA